MARVHCALHGGRGGRVCRPRGEPPLTQQATGHRWRGEVGQAILHQKGFAPTSSGAVLRRNASAWRTLARQCGRAARTSGLRRLGRQTLGGCSSSEARVRRTRGRLRPLHAHPRATSSWSNRKSVQDVGPRQPPRRTARSNPSLEPCPNGGPPGPACRYTVHSGQFGLGMLPRLPA